MLSFFKLWASPAWTHEFSGDAFRDYCGSHARGFVILGWGTEGGEDGLGLILLVPPSQQLPEEDGGLLPRVLPRGRRNHLRTGGCERDACEHIRTVKHEETKPRKEVQSQPQSQPRRS